MKKPIRVFLCHAHGDKPRVRELYEQLVACNVDVWLDEKKLLPGQEWKPKILKAVRESHVVLVCLSQKAVSKTGYVQTEIKRALDAADEQPEGTIYLIPALLEECEVPDRLSRWQWVNLSQEGGYDLLLQALITKAEKLGLLRPALQKSKNTRPAPPKPRHPLAAPPKGVKLPHIVRDDTVLRMEWCWVPGGQFTMGSNEYSNEKPIHQVMVEGFWMGRYPVTNAQFRHFVQAGGYKDQQWWTRSGWSWRQKRDVTEPRFWQDKKWNGDDFPVVGVNWYEAVAFCNWAAQKTGLAIGLPTEAQWEKGARGADGRVYPWGDKKPTAERANFNNNVGGTTVVGRYGVQGKSPYGCDDMSGNVWEWCLSESRAYPYRDDERNEIEGKQLRVLRGGSWGNEDVNWLRCGYRNWCNPKSRHYDFDFRIVLSPFYL